MITNPYRPPYPNELAHHGIFGMRWGIRRYQPYPKGYRGSGREIGDAAKAKHRPSTKSAAQVELAKRRKIEQKSKTAQVKADARIAREKSRLEMQELKTKSEILKKEAKVAKLEAKERSAQIKQTAKDRKIANKKALAEAKRIEQQTSSEKQKDLAAKEAAARKKGVNLTNTADTLKKVAGIGGSIMAIKKFKKDMIDPLRGKDANDDNNAKIPEEGDSKTAEKVADAAKTAKKVMDVAKDSDEIKDAVKAVTNTVKSGAETLKNMKVDEVAKAAQTFVDFVGDNSSVFRGSFGSGFGFDFDSSVMDVTLPDTTALAVIDDSLNRWIK